MIENYQPIEVSIKEFIPETQIEIIHKDGTVSIEWARYRFGWSPQILDSSGLYENWDEWVNNWEDHSHRMRNSSPFAYWRYYTEDELQSQLSDLQAENERLIESDKLLFIVNRYFQNPYMMEETRLISKELIEQIAIQMKEN